MMCDVVVYWDDSRGGPRGWSAVAQQYSSNARARHTHRATFQSFHIFQRDALSDAPLTRA